MPGEARSPDGIVEHMAAKGLVVPVRCEGEKGEGVRYFGLPFGWAYSSAIWQTLVAALVRGALRQRRVKGWVYMDDILLASRSKFD